MAGRGMIELHRSNSMEALVGRLAQILDEKSLPPMDTEWIVVQGAAMQKWLSIRLSEELGIWANARFPFPRHLVNQAVLSVLGHDPEQASGLDAGPLFWAVAQQLEDRIDEPEFDEIRNYLHGGNGQGAAAQDSRKRFELADRIARLFDRYTVYRPDLLQAWEKGQERGWQPAMWKGLCHTFGGMHAGALLGEFLQKVGNESGPIEGIPSRVCLFGISALPPLYMRAIAAMASRVETHLFVLSPSQQYWGDIRGGKGRVGAEPELQEGNPLLLSLGRLSGDFQQVLEENAEYNEGGPDLYRAPKEDGTMLATLQGDILELRHRRRLPVGDASAVHGDQNPPPLPLQQSDKSISVHCCHSPMRELEILHDQLASRLEADATLDARDIVVMAPNIEEYAPLIEAVFASAKEDRPWIPYRIADRADRSTYPVLQAFAQVLGILSGRMPAPAILDLLDLDSIRDRFKISEDELPQIAKWVVDSGVRWGEDKEHRKSVDQPDFSENTWRFGLDRLLLGYAMEGEERDTYNEILAYDDIEGTSVHLLGRFLNFCDAIFEARNAISSEQSPSGWASRLLHILDATVVSTEANAGEHQLVRESIATIEQDAATGKFAGRLPFDSICTLLEASWQQGGSTRGFLSVGVTFCQLMPMRSIPFRVVCLLGMSDGVYPRASQPLGFDRIASEPRLGDRTTRDDDRYLFLEAIMAAKESLHISYVGRSIKNNAELPPSVLVGELLDVLEDSFTVEGGELREKLIAVHPLQPFSPRYFADSGESHLFSYSAAYCAGANSLAVSELEPRRFLAGPLTVDSETERVVTLDDLANFFQRPTQHLLEKRLRVFLAEDESTIDAREPIQLAGLDSWKVADDLLKEAMLGTKPKELYEAFRAAGRLPLGVVGESWFDEVEYAITSLYERAQLYAQGSRLDNLPVELTIGDSKLTGSLDNIWSHGRVQVAYSRLGKRSEIGHWIRHLALCVVAPASHPTRTVLIGRPEKGAGIATVAFGDEQEAVVRLEELVRLYWAGQVAPLPFFPDTGRSFIKTFLKAKKPDRASSAFDKALEGARVLFANGPWQQKAESEDPYVAQVFKNDECLELDYRPFENTPKDYADFPTIAAALLCPLLSNREEIDS